jgi:hypothetical protein
MYLYLTISLLSCGVSLEKAGTGAAEPQRASAPLSVTSNKELSSKNVYYYEFKDKSIPLDGDFADDNTYQVSIYLSIYYHYYFIYL